MNNLKRNWEIIYTLGTMDLKLKYQNSKLGFLWSFLKPLLQFIVYYMVFGVTLKVDESPDYPLRLFFGIILWTYFTDGTGMGLGAYIGKKTLITKIHIHKLIIPIAAVYTAMLNFFINFCIFLLLYFVIEPDPFSVFHIVNAEILLFSLFMLTVSIISLNVILATLNALFRDIQSIWELLMMYGVFLMPIIYTVPIPDSALPYYYFFNPVAFPLINIRAIFFNTGDLWSYPVYIQAYLGGVMLYLCLAALVNYSLQKKVADYL